VLDHTPQTIKVEKPWGEFEQYTHNQNSTVKIITATPGGILSSQYHFKRDELWVVLDEGARVELGDEMLHPQPQQKIFIPRETIHRLSAVGDKPVRVLEISFGEFDEEDIVRLEDAYGRGGQVAPSPLLCADGEPRRGMSGVSAD
jgi:mannose-1-phosphate guanylyltransferase/mannose-6-phosphate isomerase